MSTADDAIGGLSPREREVLELIAAGKTNVEIANALGIRFDTAKWHVSELLSKLGVERREQAAKEWRHWNRVHRRWVRAAASQARERRGAVAFGAAGVLALGVVVVLVGALARDGAKGEPRILLATQDSADGIHVVDMVRGQTVLAWSSGADVLVGPRFSPDGQHIVALVDGETEGFDVRAIAVATDSGDDYASDLLGTSGAGVPVWSPDSALVAMVGERQLTLLTPDMRIVGQSEPIGVDTDRGVPVEPVWSADSQHVAVSMNYTLVIGTRDGASAVYTYDDLSAGPPAGATIDADYDGPAVLSWMDDGRLRLIVQKDGRVPFDADNPPEPWLATAFGAVDGTAVAWTVPRPTTNAELAELFTDDVATRDELTVRSLTLVEGSTYEWARAYGPWRTADGSAWVMGVPHGTPAEIGGLPETAKLVVFTEEPVVHELDVRTVGRLHPRLRPLDVVVIKD
jgi:DNA-binding CsgD family transcriptional regulator/Tol biopolymer transport system component